MKNRRVEAERAWFRAFHQLIFGILGVFLVIVIPATIWTDSLDWGIVYTGLMLVPINVMYVKRYRMRRTLNPQLSHLYRRQIGSDCLNTVAFFIAINGGKLLESNTAYIGGVLIVGVAGWVTMRIEKRMKEEDVWRPTYEQLRG
ncbi:MULTISPECIES: hypothetical protein [unclassified Exiguobacterium]|uniref:hypothetical protein n=1 Tax=Exiguobacterium TaxID=33986 RepID=UPI001BE95503|nr:MULTISPECIES: hypothetical protein [unclassified Exiguobacterium]